MNNHVVVYSPYNDKIDPRIINAQRNVFSFLHINLVQIDIENISHGSWLNDFVRSTSSDLIAIVDIDAFPICRKAFDRAIQQARQGALVGLAQVANHKDPNEIYAGPMFLAFSSQLYKELGSPPLIDDRESDVAQRLTRVASENNIDLHLIHPRFAIRPVWPLANKGVFGIGTFYGENEFFHLFQSRFSRHIDLFEAVSNDVCNGRLNFDHYLHLLGLQERRSKFSRKLSKAVKKLSRFHT